jgi:hypothetical protein
MAVGGVGKDGGLISLLGGNGSNVSGATNNGGNIYLAGGAGSPSGNAGNVLLGMKSNGTLQGNVGIGTTSPLSTLTVTGSGCFSKGTGATLLCGTTAGNIYYNAANTGAYDVAEDYVASDLSITAGDIIAFDPTNPLHIVKAAGSLRPTGVISTDPGLILGGADGSIQGSSTRPVALSGRVPTRVNLEGGSIAIGDSIALSSVPGVGKKASGNGDVIGIALEPYTGSSGTGLINVFVNLRQNIDLSQFSLNTAIATSSAAAALVSASSSQADAASALIAVHVLSSQIDSISIQVNDLASSTVTFADLASSTVSLASTTAAKLASSTPFIQTIANAVVALLQSSGQAISSAATWTVGEIHATLAVFTDVKTNTIETQTAAVSNGLEMTDSATGAVYCVRITNGDFAKIQGSCPSSDIGTSSAATVAPVVTTVPIMPTAPIAPITTITTTIATTTSASTSTTAQAPSDGQIGAVSTSTAVTLPVPNASVPDATNTPVTVPAVSATPATTVSSPVVTPVSTVPDSSSASAASESSAVAPDSSATGAPNTSVSAAPNTSAAASSDATASTQTP